MKTYYTAPDGLELHHGDCRSVLASLPAESVDVIVTSPPYLGLRRYLGVEPSVWGGSAECEHQWGDWQESHDEREPETVAGKTRTTDRFYGDPSRRFNGNHQKHTEGSYCRLCGAWLGCFGLESDVSSYVAHTVEVCRALGRVLKASGSMWWNVGDSYYSATVTQGRNENRSPNTSTLTRHGSNGRSPALDLQTSSACRRADSGLKPKDLMLIPYRVAIALQEDGWYVRSAITWAKKSCMPESVTDRPTCATEMIWLLTKSATYYFDAEAVREEQSRDWSQEAWTHQRKYGTKESSMGQEHGGSLTIGETYNPAGRNLRNFWLLGPSPLREAHYAAYSPEIPRRAISAGSSERGVCPTCGKPWVRDTEIRYTPSVKSRGRPGMGTSLESGAGNSVGGWNDTPALDKHATTLGWRPPCAHKDETPIPATVLDPFVGSGTTLIVARQLGRRGIGIDASEVYLRTIAIPRIEGQTPNLFALEVAL